MAQFRTKSKVLLICLAFLVVMPAWSQGFKARLVGRVTDSSGAVIPNASVTATNVDTAIGTHTESTGEGDYVIPELGPGN